MRKLLAIFVLGVALVVLAACGSSYKSPAPSSGNESPTVSVTKPDMSGYGGGGYGG